MEAESSTRSRQRLIPSPALRPASPQKLCGVGAVRDGSFLFNPMPPALNARSAGNDNRHTMNTERLAREFSRLIRLEITKPGAMHYVEHHADPDDAVCPTGDYCDSNMVMWDAFRAIEGRDMDMENDADRDLWNAAWQLAKVERFYPSANA